MASFCSGVYVDTGFKGVTARRVGSQAEPLPPGSPAVKQAPEVHWALPTAAWGARNKQLLPTPRMT